jgi:hypothetical protein
MGVSSVIVSVLNLPRQVALHSLLSFPVGTGAIIRRSGEA